MPPKHSAKIRVHHGTHTECLYALRSYGIADGVIPISLSNNSLLLHHHKMWLDARIARDNEKEMNRLGKPGKNEVDPVTRNPVASLPSNTAISRMEELSNSSTTDAGCEIQPRQIDILFGKDPELVWQLEGALVKTHVVLCCSNYHTYLLNR